MPSGSSGHVAVGGFSATLGTTFLVAGVMRPAFLEGDLLDTPYWSLALTCGAVLTISGLLIMLFMIQKKVEPAPAVPAHVAFATRMSVPPLVPPLPAPAPRPQPASVPRLPTPAAPKEQRLAPVRADIVSLDAQIRELTRQINKAGVMLATGQLSQGGYLAYVEDLKKQRGSLEAQRVRAELKTS